ncbi:MAG: FtsX-like permease family protein [Actinomycetota bacterium]
MAAAPRVLEIATVDDLRETLAEATPEERNIRFDTRTEIGAGAPGVPFSNIEWIGAQLRDENLPPSVLELVADEQWVFDTPQFTVGRYPDLELPRHPPTFRFRQQSEIEDHLVVQEGSLPLPRDPELRLEGPDCPIALEGDLAEFEAADGQECSLVEIPVFETAITDATAVEFGFALLRRDLVVGDRFMLRPDQTQLGFRDSLANLGQLRLIVEVSALIELDPPEDDYWYGDILLHRPRVRENNDFEFVFAAGLLGPEQYRPFRAAAPGTGLDFSWRYLIDADLVVDTDSEGLAADLEKIAPEGADAVTLLPGLLQDHLAQRRLTLRVWSLVGLVFAVAAVAAVAALARAEVVRRATVDALQSGRGASRLQLQVAETATAVWVVSVSVVAGAGLAWLAFPDASSADPAAASGLFAVAGTVAMVGVAGVRSTVPRVRRLVVRGVLALAATGVVVLLRRRETVVDESISGELDPTLMIAPALVLAAIAVFGSDLIGPGARLASRFAAGHPGPVWFVGLRRVVATARTVRGPVLTVVIAMGAAVLASVIGSSIEASQDTAARQRVGAEVRLETSLPEIPLPADIVDGLAGDAVFAASFAFQRYEGPRGAFVADLVAIDGSDASVGSDGVAAATLVGPWDAPHLPDRGERIALELSAFVVPLQIVDQVEQLPGVPTGRPTVVIDRRAFETLTTERLATPDIAFLDDASTIPRLVELIDGRPGVTLSSRGTEVDRLAGDPLSTWTRRGLTLAAAGGLALGLIAAMAASAVHAQDRHRDLGLVAIVGGTRRDTVRIALAELGPIFGAAALLGVIGGVIAARLLGPNLSFEAFASGTSSAGVVVDWPALAAIGLAMVLALAAVLAATARRVRRLDHAMMLREGNR